MISDARIAITGASGLVGRAVRDALRARGVDVVRLVRRRDDALEDAVFWDPERGEIEAEKLEGVRAVVHLAGENVAGARWNDEVRARIMKSRTEGTRLIATAIAGLTRKPKVLVSASGISFYGDCGEAEVDEGHPKGSAFLSEVAAAWEASLEPARAAGIRVVALRIAPVLTRDGGALEKMLLPFKLGLGGRLGRGTQWMSFVSLRDLVRICERAIDDEALVGAINATCPEPIRNVDFTRALAATLKRPAIFPVPEAAVRLVLGGLAEEALASMRVIPKRLLELGFEFEDPSVPAMLRAALSTDIRERSA